MGQASVQRLPTVKADQAALQAECCAAWHLTNDGSWVELHSAADIEERWEQAANSLANSCHGLDIGARMVTEVGNVTLVASRKEDGVWIGLRDHRGNAITLLSALHRIETRVRSRVDLESVAPRVETRPLQEPDSEAIDGPNLADVVTYLNAVTDMTARYANRSTICDYWERSLEGSALSESIAFVCADGFIAPSSNRALTQTEIADLDNAFASWKLRVRMALGTIYSKIPLLKTPPWR